jgi:hypothetical protein
VHKPGGKASATRAKSPGSAKADADEGRRLFRVMDVPWTQPTGGTGIRLYVMQIYDHSIIWLFMVHESANHVHRLVAFPTVPFFFG